MAEQAKYQRYRMLADEKNLSDYRVSKEVGIAQETLSSWKRGKYIPKRDKLEKLADFFDVDIDFFFKDGLMERFARDNVAPIAERVQQIYEVSAGNGRVSSAPETKSHEDGEYAVVIGDSMYPTLHDGDLVRIIETSEVSPIDIALVKVNGDENTLKHVEITSEGVWIRGENKEAFEDRFYSMQEVLTLPVQIVGKAVEIVSRKL